MIVVNSVDMLVSDLCIVAGCGVYVSVWLGLWGFGYCLILCFPDCVGYDLDVLVVFGCGLLGLAVVWVLFYLLGGSLGIGYLVL